MISFVCLPSHLPAIRLPKQARHPRRTAVTGEAAGWAGLGGGLFTVLAGHHLTTPFPAGQTCGDTKEVLPG